MSPCITSAVFAKAGEGRLHRTPAGPPRAVQRAGAPEGSAVCGVSPSVHHPQSGRVRDAPRCTHGQEEGELHHPVSRWNTALLRHESAGRQVSRTVWKLSDGLVQIMDG